jgi:hypothetical protein
MTRPVRYEEEEERRRRLASWVLFGTVLVVVLFLGNWLATGANRPDAATQGPAASPTPTTSIGVGIGRPQAGSSPTSGTAVSDSSANNGNGGNPGHPLTVTGVVQGMLAPNAPATLVVTIGNPNSQDILVTSVSGSVTSVTSAGDTGKPACSTTWFHVGSFSGSLLITKNHSGTVSLPVTLDNFATVNQDNCKRSTYTFSFTAQARQA